MVDYTNSSEPFMSSYSFIVWVLVILGVLIALYFIYKRYLKKHLVKRANDLILLEVKLPKKFKRQEYENLKTSADIISSAEQFFSSLSGLFEPGITGFIKGQPTISFEYVSRDKEIIFFVGVPRSYVDLVQKQIQSFYPDSSVEPSGDFRIFKQGLEISCGTISTSRSFVFPKRHSPNLNMIQSHQ